ncbi:MAG TPA: class D sortase [Bryobacteraceae bacterium]
MRIRTRTRPSRLRRWIETLLLVAGIAGVTAYVGSRAIPAVWQDWESWTFDRNVHGEAATVGEYLEDRADRIVHTIRTWAGIEKPGEQAHPKPPRPAPHRRRAIPENGVIGRLTIPRLGLSVMVREGVASKTLSLAAGHIPGTALPGERGNVAVAGHRDTLFRSLKDIRKDDVIEFQTLDGRFDYEVGSTEIVTPKDVGVLQPGREDELTLVTCYPFYYVGSAPDRFIVKAREISEVPPTLEVRQEIQGNVVPPEERRARPAAPTPPRKPAPQDGTQRIGFSIPLHHSRELAPGISLGISDADTARQDVNGWMWLMPDHRTIWLKSQRTNDPVVFYSEQSGKRREVHITGIGRDSVTGYLLLAN